MRLSGKSLEKLGEFEECLNPQDPEKGHIRPSIIGYGEMSTVFRFGIKELSEFAFKRMAIFHSEDEVSSYKETYLKYHSELKKRGIDTPDYGFEIVRGKNGKLVVYILQALLDPEKIANKLLHTSDKAKNINLYQKILTAIDSSFRINESGKNQTEKIEIGLDGQISNWAYDKKLLYLDTSTPLLRENGIEKLNPELFLRICPSYLVWIIRLFFLKDVMNRYYDIRLVVIDTLANLYKEKKEAWVSEFLGIANDFFAKSRPDIKPLSIKEVQSYYSEDKIIWRLFLFFRKVERTIRVKILRKPYDIILPDKIER